MNGARMPEPAPWASTSTVSAPAGSIHMGGIVRLRGRGVAGLGPVALGPTAGEVVRLRPPRRLVDRDRLRLGHPEVAQDVADRVLVAGGEVLVHDVERLHPALTEERAPPELVLLDVPDQVRDGRVAIGEVVGGRAGGLLVARPAPRLQR